MAVKLCIFDFDQTLIDSTSCIIKSVEHAFQGVSVVPNRVDIQRQIGLPLEKVFENLRGHNILTYHEFRERLRGQFRQQWRFEVKLYSGVKERLSDLLSAGYTLAICTSKNSRSTLEMIEWFELENLFSEIIGVDLTPKPKPYPHGIELIMQHTGIPKESTIMIGDHPVDMKMAENAEVSSIGVRTGGFSDTELHNRFLLTIIDSVKELTPTLIEHLISK